MVRCRTLGCLELSSSAVREYTTVLSQPKRAALLIHLALTSAGGLEQRDSLLALFWPELDQEHARGALRRALTFLRHELGDDVIRTCGAELVGIDPERLWCDAVAFNQALLAGDLDGALELYRGDFLPGFHVTGNGELERWLEQRRRELRDRAAEAASHLADRAEAAGSVPDALRWARRALELRPDDERALQKLLLALDRGGDRARALHEYEAFARRLEAEYQAQPSPETQQLVAEVRQRHATVVGMPAERFVAAGQLTRVPEPTAQAVTGGAAAGRGWPARHAVLAATVALGVLGVVVGTAIVSWRNAAGNTGTGSVVVVMPFENRTGSTELDPLGTVVAEWVTQGLTGAPFLTVLDTRGAQAAARKLGAAAAPAAVGRETGAGVVVAGSYILQGDSLQFQAQISSTVDGTILRGIEGVRAPRDGPMAGVEYLRQRVLAALASLHDEDISAFVAPLAQPPSYAAYLEYVEGLELYMSGWWGSAARHFLQAAVLDPTFLTAGIWAAQGSVVSWAVSQDEAEARQADSLITGLRRLKDQLRPFDRARLDFVVALRESDMLEGYQATLRMVDASPGSIDARREAGIAALRVLRPREALTRLQELDPQRGRMRGPEHGYWSTLASVHHLLGQHEEELSAARRSRQLYPSATAYYYGELRALAALGRTAEVDSVLGELLTSGQAGLIAYGIAGELMAHGYAAAAHRLAQYASDHPAAPPPSDSEAAQQWLEEDNTMRRWVRVPYCYLGERLETRSFAERARDEWVHWRAELALLAGDADTAASRAAQLRDPGAHGLLLARILAAQGKLGAARAALQQWEGRMVQARGTLRGLEIERASALVRLGDLERAIEVLSEGIGRRPLPNTTTTWDGHAHPEFAPLFGHPRFRALIKPRG